MFIDLNRYPQSDREEELCREPFELLVKFFNRMTGVREQYPSDEVLRQWVTPIILSALEAHLTHDTDSANWYVRFESGLDEELLGQLRSVAMGLSSTGTLDHEQIEQTEAFEFRLSDEFLEQHPNLKAQILNHSRPFDVHKWSSHPEVNAFVDTIYEEHFTGGYANIRKKHIKTLLLDLYVAWKDDPALKIAVPRSRNTYEGRTRYNELHISGTTIDVVDTLLDARLILQAIGRYDRVRGRGNTTRIWPTPKLLKLFEQARWGSMDIDIHPDRECIILHDNNKDDQEYEDTDETKDMRENLERYNSLLALTFIDIPILEKPYINCPDFNEGGYDEDDPHEGNDPIVYINQTKKFVRRIFNRSSFDFGGRYYGGWWQNCPKDWRKHIFLNDRAVSEIDYKGFHIVLLYALRGIDYWRTINQDPYTIEPPDFITNTNQFRDVCKDLLLMALNAADERGAFNAFRYEAATGSPEKRFSNTQLLEILNRLREKHAPIADAFASDAGIRLQKIDSQIAEYVIESFTSSEIPILCMHDSFIVPFGHEHELEAAMTQAFGAVTGVPNVRLKEATYNPLKEEPLEQEDGFDYAAWSLVLEGRTNPTRSERYLYNLRKFKEWLDSHGIPFNDLQPGGWGDDM